MIKNIAYYPLQCALNSTPPVLAMLSALRAGGIATQECSMDSDAVLLWSSLWFGRMAANRPIYQHYRNLGKPVIFVDIGALNRGVTWKVAVNSINATGYYGHETNLDWNRPAKLQLKLSTPTNTKSHVVIAAQHTHSEQVNGIQLETWIGDQIRTIRKYTDRPIHIRPHPRCKLNTSGFKQVTINNPVALLGTYDSFDLPLDCHAIVNYNSGPGIQAAIAGCRPVVDQSSLAYPVAVNIADIDCPYVVDRNQWLVKTSHTEYTVEELQQGLWLKRIEPALA